MPPDGKDDASGSPWISSLPRNLAIEPPSEVGSKNESCFSAVGAGQRLEDVCEVGRAVLEGPLHHRGGNLVRQFDVKCRSPLEGALETVEDVLGEPLTLGLDREDVAAEDDVLVPASSRSVRPWIRSGTTARR